MSTEAMKLALEALKNSVDLVSNEAREAESYYGKYQSRLARVQGLVALEVAHQAAIKALEEALAKQTCEMGEMCLQCPDAQLKQEQGEPVSSDDFFKMLANKNPNPFPTQKRTWVALTDEEIEDCYKQGGIGRAVQMLKEKNT